MLELLKPFDIGSLIEEKDFLPDEIERRSQLELMQTIERLWAGYIHQPAHIKGDAAALSTKATVPSPKGRAYRNHELLKINHPFYLNKRGIDHTHPYLPAAINQIATTNKPVLIAVGTNALHNRLVDEEIPVLSKHLLTNGYINKPLQTLDIRETTNYICKAKMIKEIHLKTPASYKKSHLKKILQEANARKSAEKRHFTRVPPAYLDVVEVDDCFQDRCKFQLDCDYNSLFYQCDDGQYDFMVVNQSHIVSSLGGFLDPYAFSAIVVEETHDLEQVVLNTLGCQVGLQHIYNTLSEYAHQRTGKELIMHGERLIGEIWRHTDFNEGSPSRRPFKLTENIKRLAREMMGRLEFIYHYSGNQPCPKLAKLLRLTHSLTSADEHIFWAGIHNNGAPIMLNLQVSTLPRDLDNNLGHILTRQHTTPVLFTYIGLKPHPGEKELSHHLAGAVPYSYLPAAPAPNMLGPNHCHDLYGRLGVYLEKEYAYHAPAHPDYAIYQQYKSIRMRQILELTVGHTLFLFRTPAAMRSAWELLSKSSNMPQMLLQQASYQKDELARLFAAGKRACILALFRDKLELDDSLLTAIIIDELPFPLADPLYGFRKTVLQQRYYQDSLNETNPDVATMTLELARQAGRLAGDRKKYSFIAILDSRAAYGPFKDMVRDALPGSNYIDLDQLSSFQPPPPVTPS